MGDGLVNVNKREEKKFRVLGVLGSPRARFEDTEKALDIVRKAQSYQNLYTEIYMLASQKKVSNTEALAWMALFGAYQSGAEIDLLHLKRFYGIRDVTCREVFSEKTDKADKLADALL